MLFGPIDFIIFGLGILFLAAFIFFYLKGKKDESLFDPLNEKDFPLKQIYFVGYAVMETLHYEYKSKRDRKLRKEISVLYGDKYAEYYLRVVYAQKVTFAMLMLCLAAPLYGLGDEPLLFVIMVAFAGLAFYYFGSLTEQMILKRSQEMLHDFSNVVSKLALLTNAGMILREAWEQVAYTGDGTIYKEMQASIVEMENGVSEVDALFNFGSRCMIPEVKKFASTLIQGIVKGNAELCEALTQQSKEVWNLKKQQARREGEKAASKLMIPIAMMFVGILIMIIIPIFANIGQ